jgi:hypothetical protein
MGDGTRGTIKTIQEILARRQYPEATGRGPRVAIQGSLNNPTYQGSILKPTIGTCPLAKQSIPRTGIEIQYRYADGSEVPGASYVLQFDDGGAVASFETNSLGRAHEIVPKDRTYRFRFEKDKTDFSILPDYQCLAVVPAPVLSTWIGALLRLPTVAKGGLSWYSSKVVDESDFLICPSFGKMAYLAILENTPFYTKNKAVPEVVTAEVAQALAVVLKQFPGDEAEAWTAIAFNRLGVTCGADSRVIQSLLWQLHNHESTTCRTLVDLLNSVGKGNAYRWIKNSLVAKLDACASSIVQNLEAVLSVLDEAAGRIVQSTTSGVDVTGCAKDLQVQIAHVKGVAAAKIGEALAICFQRARALKKSDLEYWATDAHVERCNTYVQVSNPLQERVPTSNTTWVELLYQYKDQKEAVSDARFVLQTDSKQLVAAGLLNKDGIARIEVPKGFSYFFFFRQDPKPYTPIDTWKRLPAVLPTVAIDLLATELAESHLTAVTLSAGDGPFISDTDLLASPTVAKLIDLVALHHTPVQVPNAEREEFRRIAYSLLMTPQLPTDQEDGLWRTAGLNRIGARCGESGGVIQALLLYLIRTKTSITTEDLVKRLNHVGTGNAVDWLRDLAGRLNTIIDDTARDVAGILSDVEAVLQSFATATDALAKIETRHYANVLCSRFAPVKANAENRVRTALQLITQQLATALNTRIEYRCAATLELRNPFCQTAEAMELRETSKVVWIDLQYCFADGNGVSDATCVLSGDLKSIKPPKLDPNGFAHILVPPGKTGGFRFLKDPKPYELFSTYKCVANPAASLDGMVASAITKIAGKSLQWDRCMATIQQKTFDATPTIGRILFNVVRGKTPFCIQEFERGTADTIHMLLTCPQVNRDRWWTAAAFNHLVTLSEDGFLIAALLYKIHCHRRDNAGANPPLSDLVRIMNTCGKGHAVKCLEARDFTGLCASVSNDLKSILKEFADLLDSLNPNNQTDKKTKLSSVAYQSVSELMRLARSLAADAPVKVAAALEVLVNSISPILGGGGVGADQPLTMRSCNLVRQEKLPLDTPVQPGEPWLAVRYRYADLKPVPVADVVLRLPGPVDSAAGALAEGFRLLNNPPSGAAQVYFRHESEFPGPRFFQADADFASVASPTAPVPAGGLSGTADCDWAQFLPPKCIRFDWNDNRMNVSADFQAAPSIGRLARNCVLRGTNRIAGKSDEIDEMVGLLEAMLEGGADGSENSLRLWCAIALNRIGALSGPGPLHESESRLRKAVLSRIEFEAVTLNTLIELLNSVGRGRSVKWLSQLNANLIPLRDAVAANIIQILNYFAAELQPITVWPHAALNVPATRVHGRIAPVRAQVVANMQLVFQKYVTDLGALLPLLLPRPYVYDVIPYCTNVLTQKKREFPEAADKFRPPPAWHREPIIVRVGCDYADGTPVNTTFVVEQQNGLDWIEVQRGAAVGRWQTNALPAGGVFRFYVDHDADVFTIFDKAKPWAQPYPTLPNAVCTTPQANLWASNRETLEWGDFTVCDEPQFRANPTLGRILADCVISRVPFVSSPNDVQDICVVMAAFITSPGTTNDAAMLARAGIQLLGTIQDVGSVIRGIILYSKDKEVRSAVWLLRRMNWAGKGSAVKWLKTNVLPGNPHIGVAQQRMSQILADFRGYLTNICAAGNVRKKLKDSLNGFSKNASDAGEEIDAKMPPALKTAVERIDTFLKSKDLPFYHDCGSARTIYTQEAASEFLESGNQTSFANKQALDQLAIANIAAANQRPMVDPAARRLFYMEPVGEETLRRYLATPPTHGATARQMAPILAAMSPAHLGAFFDKPGDDWTRSTSGSMVSLVHADGTLLRYKPDGDDYQKPPCATYCVEVKRYDAALNSSGLQNTAFKVDAQGNAVPKHPGEVRNPVLAGGLGATQADVQNHTAYYHDHLMKAGHRPIRNYKTL